MRDVKTVPLAAGAPVLRILIGGRYVAGGIVAAISFANRLAICVGEAHGQSAAVTLLSLHLQCIVIGVGVAIQIADGTEQTRLISLVLADVRLPGTASVDVGVGRRIRLIEVVYGVVDV